MRSLLLVAMVVMGWAGMMVIVMVLMEWVLLVGGEGRGQGAPHPFQVVEGAGGVAGAAVEDARLVVAVVGQ